MIKVHNFKPTGTTNILESVNKSSIDEHVTQVMTKQQNTVTFIFNYFPRKVCLKDDTDMKRIVPHLQNA